MTEAELQQEWQYRVDERLGILCEGATPTAEQEQAAREEADNWILSYEE